MTEYWVLTVGILVFAGHLFSAIFKRTNIPDVLPLIFIGIVIGIFIEPEDAFGEIGHVFLEIALALLLFEGGAHLTFSTIKKTIGKNINIGTFDSPFINALLFLNQRGLESSDIECK